MIERQQIAEALSRLDPRDREILDYSLRRRVPDEDLAALFEAEPAEVARRRAAAIETLSADLGAQRGADLGHILKELLEGETWAAAEAAAPPSRRPSPSRRDPTRARAEAAPTIRRWAPAPRSRLRGARRRRAGPRASAVLGMLSGQEEPAAAAAEAEPEPPSRNRGRRRLLVGVAAAAAVLVPAGMVAALATSEDSDNGPRAPRRRPRASSSPRARVAPARPSRSPPTRRAPSSTPSPA